MKKRSKKINGILSTVLALIFIFASAVLYEQGIISDDIYSDILSDIQNETVDVTGGDIEVHYLDVGQAECILIKAPEKTVLIDAGNIGCGKTIESYLRAEDVSHIDLFILTHPHADHIGSASDIIKSFPVDETIMPEIPDKYLPTTKLFENLLVTFSENNSNVSYSKVGTVYDLGGGASIEILGPLEYSGSNLNNYSIISKLTYGDTDFLFTGDAEKEIELSLVDAKLNLSCTVLSAGHHGSSTSNSALFLKLANPEYAIISCGYDNDYGHPHSETISAYTELGIKYYRTDYDGNIVCRSDGKTVTVTTEK